MKATRGNKVYTINEAQRPMYVAQGYDIIDDEGKLLQYGVGKTVSYEKYKEVEEKAIKLEKDNKKLKEEIKKLKEVKPAEVGEKDTK